jgi:2'-5' RNA ligase
MAASLTTGPGAFGTDHALHRFLLVIHPHEVLAHQVTAWKEELAQRIGSFSGRHSIPHITLFFADLPASREADVVRGIASGVVGHRAFTLHYDGITHFPDKRTIHVRPVEKEAIARVRGSVARHVRQVLGSDEVVHVTTEPHLTIAAGLKPTQFDQAWELLAPHLHRSEQLVNELLLLRRALRPGNRYQVVKTFPLSPQEPTLF